jgi:phage I-like protein
MAPPCRDYHPMSKASQIALMSAHTFTASKDGAVVPEWVHLLPSGDADGIATGDKRGPYFVKDAKLLIAASFAQSDRLPIDENHSTDLAAPKGQPSPARGWIVKMEARDDGIWGQVEWNDAGKELVSTQAYRALSPVIVHDDKKVIKGILRASLVNRPNLRGLTALNMESDMTLEEFMAELAKSLGLKDGAGAEDITGAIAALKEAGDAGGETQNRVDMQSQLAEIGVALGVEDGEHADILAAAKSLQAATGDESTAITALQAEISTLTKSLNSVTEATGKKTATDFVDGEIKRGRAGVKPLRDHYIAMHMKDADRVEKEIGALPILAGTTIVNPSPDNKDGKIALNAEQAAVADQLGMDHKDYAAQLEEDRANEEAL